jgi:hypothetical protein
VVTAAASVLQSAGPGQLLAELAALRSALHKCALRRADAWFELEDALLVTEAVPSLPYLSLEATY